MGFWIIIFKVWNFGASYDNLIYGPSFDHNLCFNYPKESCEPILNIYVPKVFQWYKDLFNPIAFDPYNRSLKIQKFIKSPTSKMGVHLGMWRFIPSIFPTFLGAWDVIPELPFWLAPLQVVALVVNPKLGLQQMGWQI
jgi:hypothetical protein